MWFILPGPPSAYNASRYHLDAERPQTQEDDPGESQTHDPSIKSAVLYLLSYRTTIPMKLIKASENTMEKKHICQKKYFRHAAAGHFHGTANYPDGVSVSR